MTIQEAIEKAGPGGKIRRIRTSGTVRELDIATIQDYQASRFTFYDITATDWQVVEPERIEAGDIVRTEEHNPDLEVLSVRNGIMKVRECVTFEMGTACVTEIIRKGPKKHVFEGVEFRKEGVGPFWGVPYSPSGSFRWVTNNGKTYRMTLEEMP